MQRWRDVTRHALKPDAFDQPSLCVSQPRPQVDLAHRRLNAFHTLRNVTSLKVEQISLKGRYTARYEHLRQRHGIIAAEMADHAAIGVFVVSRLI